MSERETLARGQVQSPSRARSIAPAAATRTMAPSSVHWSTWHVSSAACRATWRTCVTRRKYPAPRPDGSSGSRCAKPFFVIFRPWYWGAEWVVSHQRRRERERERERRCVASFKVACTITKPVEMRVSVFFAFDSKMWRPGHSTNIWPAMWIGRTWEFPGRHQG